MIRTTGKTLLLCALLPFFLQARESICLKSGFCLEAESHMISDGMLIVQSGHGTLQFPVDEVEEILALPALPQPSAAEKEALTTKSDVANSDELLLRAALQQGLEPDFVRSVAMVESGLHQQAVSPKGALGLMQLMPSTAGQLGVDPTVAGQNAVGGAAFLRQLLIKYKGNSALALAAYNAGPGAVEKYKGVPPYLETQRYIVKVLQEYARQQRKEAKKAPQAVQAKRTSSAPKQENLQAERITTPPDRVIQ